MAERTLPGLGLTGFWDLGANEWNGENDLNLLTLSAVAQLSVISATTALPGSPTNGDIYIVPDGANANKVAVRDDDAWVFLTPTEGWRAWVRDTDRLMVFDSSAWAEISGNPDAEFDSVGVNAETEAGTRLAVNSPAVLFNREVDDVLLKLNKEASTDDAAMTFQSNYSGRALIGLLGSDDFVFTVSPDGSTYTQALIIDKDTAVVGFPQHPKFAGFTDYQQYNAANVWFQIAINITEHNDQAAVASGVFTAPHDGYFVFGGGAEFELNGAAPTAVSLAFSVDGATPLPQHMTRLAPAVGGSGLAITGFFKLSEGDTVRLMGRFDTNDGFFAEDRSYFWGHQIS